MNEYNVSIEFNIGANSPLEAAKRVEEMIKDSKLQYYVQDDATKEITSVDLAEEDEDMVLPVSEYTPVIVK